MVVKLGFALSLAQADDKRDAAKALRGFGGAGVLEVVEDDAGGARRAVYTVKFAEAVFVLHCFQKKSKRGIATPKEDMDIINARRKTIKCCAARMHALCQFSFGDLLRLHFFGNLPGDDALQSNGRCILILPGEPACRFFDCPSFIPRFPQNQAPCQSFDTCLSICF